MKLGHAEDFIRPLKTLEEIKSWFCNKGDTWLGKILVKLLQTVTGKFTFSAALLISSWLYGIYWVEGR